MKREIIQNRKLNEIYKFEANELMKAKIKRAKSLLDAKCPELFIKLPKIFLNNKFFKIPSKKINNNIFFII